MRSEKLTNKIQREARKSDISEYEDIIRNIRMGHALVNRMISWYSRKKYKK